MKVKTIICAAMVAASMVAVLPLYADAANPDWGNLEEVIIVTKCHLDVGYTHTVPELVERYRTVYMDKALALFDSDLAKPSDLRVRWTMPAWLIDAILKGQYAPERRAKIEDAVRQHRLMWHALPFTSEPEASDVEELVRMFSYGSNLSRRFGFDLPRYAKQTDVPEYAWVMPTLLAHAGVKFLQMGINPCSKSNAVVATIPPLCWWEGPDGSRILLGFSPQYGWWGQRGSVTPPKGWRHKTWLAYYMKGDNAGPMSRKEVDDILRQARETLPGVKVRFGDPADFADAIIAEEKAHPSLPVVRGDMPDTWIHGMMSLPETTAIHRRTTGDLVTLGQLDTTLRAFGIATKPVAELLDCAYRESGLYSEHTWGMRGHGVRGPKLFQPDWRARYEAGEYKEFDATFQYHADYARCAHKAAQDGIKARMAALARSVAAEGPRVVVFNPLPYARDAVVEVEMPEGYSLPDGVREGGKVKFLAKGLPAGGYKTFSGIFNRAEHVERVENLHDLHVLHGQAEKLRHFTVKFDLEKGGIASLVENATGRELVKQGGHVLGQFLHERFSRNEVARYSKVYNERQKNDGLSKPGMPDAVHSPYAAITPSGWRAHMKRSPLGVEVVMTPDDTKGLAKAYELRFAFPDHLPCVDIVWRVEDKTPDPIPEGGWLCLPFNVERPSFRVGRIGGTIDPAKDIIFGANRDILCADRGITVRSGPGGAGVGVASADLPLWSLGRPGLWRYEPDFVPTEPEVFANLYNNQWNTNYPLWIPGSWSASLRVYPVAEGADEEQAVFTPAWNIRQPCVAAFVGKETSNRVEHVERVETLHDLRGPKNQEGVSLSRKGVRVTAFCPNPDGDGIVLRVWEQAGIGGEITVSLPAGMNVTEARPVNLRGENVGEAIVVKDGKFSFDLGAWSPKSFILSCGRGGRGMTSAPSLAAGKSVVLPVPKNVPALMKSFGGADVKTRKGWEEIRAPELLARFERDEYGRRPSAAEERGRVSFETYRECEAFGGKAICKHVRVKYDGPNGKHSFPITAYIPKVGRPAPVFVYIAIDFHTKYDADGAVTTSEYWPVEQLIDRGYATAAFSVIRVAADKGNAGFSQGIFHAVQPERARGPDSWATISAWAWGASRVMDWIETEPLMDAKHVGVVGHSRGGKTALWAGVTDKRFAMACSNESGCGGAKLNHIELPKSESIDVISGPRRFHYWFCRNFRAYAGKEMEMDFDQHELIALMAPRLVCVGSATKDNWAGQLGEWWAAKLASPAWELYGKKGLVGDKWPDPETPQQEGDVSYHLRTGEHFLKPYDWGRYMDFADKHGWRNAPCGGKRKE